MVEHVAEEARRAHEGAAVEVGPAACEKGPLDKEAVRFSLRRAGRAPMRRSQTAASGQQTDSAEKTIFPAKRAAYVARRPAAAGVRRTS